MGMGMIWSGNGTNIDDRNRSLLVTVFGVIDSSWFFLLERQFIAGKRGSLLVTGYGVYWCQE